MHDGFNRLHELVPFLLPFLEPRYSAASPSTFHLTLHLCTPPMIITFAYSISMSEVKLQSTLTLKVVLTGTFSGWNTCWSGGERCEPEVAGRFVLQLTHCHLTFIQGLAVQEFD